MRAVRRRLVLAVATLVVALSTSGCHEIICGQSSPGWKSVFELVGGVYRCEQVKDDPKPYAIISYSPGAPNRGDRVRFDAYLSHPSAGRIVRYAWDLDDDGSFDDGDTQVVEKTFTEARNHKIGLLVVDSEGERDRRTIEMTVFGSEGQSPVAILDATPLDVRPDDAVTFNAGRSHDPDGTIVDYSLDFQGDGTYDRGGNVPGPVQFAYREEGTYRAVLRVRDNDGREDFDAVNITVHPGATGGGAEFTINPNPAPINEVVAFDAAAAGPDIAKYEWDFTGDGVYDATVETPQTGYRYGETYQPGQEILIGLRVTSTDGQRVATGSRILRLTEPRPRLGRLLPEPWMTDAGAAKRRFTARLAAAAVDGGNSAARRGGGKFTLSRQALVGELRGRLRGSGAAAHPLTRLLRATWVGRLNMTAQPARRRASFGLLALATFERAPGNTCVRLRLNVRGGRRTGTLVVVGGTGDGATLAARASFRWRFARTGGVVLDGAIRSGQVPPRPLSASCARLAARR
jgi:PKD repeat protein